MSTRAPDHTSANMLTLIQEGFSQEDLSSMSSQAMALMRLHLRKHREAKEKADALQLRVDQAATLFHTRPNELADYDVWVAKLEGLLGSGHTAQGGDPGVEFENEGEELGLLADAVMNQLMYVVTPGLYRIVGRVLVSGKIEAVRHLLSTFRKNGEHAEL